ncbi:uncharacterized protein LOC131230955 [Magnolia sinica]|uniref:uncharacterized protein LOC131230955 n=1 Tax=Magnolia sinica TaxID=86752 RepID=UPI002657F762|nr:uncharacterized protein LOC131230955 [Magnolia sinica]
MWVPSATRTSLGRDARKMNPSRVLESEMASPSTSRVSSKLKPKPSTSVRLAPAIYQKSCPICLRSIEGHRAAVIKVCFHAYCIDCIRKWSDLKRNCPLCNAEFDRWFFNIRVSTGDFEEERLADLKERKKVVIEGGFRRRRSEIHHRLLSRSRDQLHSVIQRSRPLPWRRSFGQSRFMPSHVGQRNQAELVAERVLQWRASIYKRRLQAIPLHCPSRDSLHQKIRNNDAKEQIQRRLEPWIRRELHAILGDSDPSVIVHLATSLWISSLEEEFKVPSKTVYMEDKFVQQLRPFLHDQTDMFWHELRCFAESSFTMAAYDSVVDYKQLD